MADVPSGPSLDSTPHYAKLTLSLMRRWVCLLWIGFAFVKCTYRTYSMLLKILPFALYTSPLSVQALYVYSRGGPHSSPAPLPSLIYCASPLISPLLIPHFEWSAGLYLWGRHRSHSIKNWPRWRNLKWAKASQSHRTCVADSSASRHLLQVGSFINPNLKRCPFRWQCPVYSPTIHFSWSLFNFNRSLVLLAEGPGISSFAGLSPVMDSHEQAL
jgi:hypothetical protein